MLDALIAEQKRLDLRDRAFALTLGVARRTWCATRRGDRPLSPRIVHQAMKAYPHLMQTGVFFLLSDNTKLKTSITKLEREPSNIDAEASEATRTLVLTGDRQTLACRATEAAPAGQGQGGRTPDRTNVLKAPQCYVVARPSASDLTSRAVSRVGEAAV